MNAAKVNCKAKFYYNTINFLLRELVGGREAKIGELANVVGAGTSVLRMWYIGDAHSINIGSNGVSERPV